MNQESDGHKTAAFLIVLSPTSYMTVTLVLIRSATSFSKQNQCHARENEKGSS